MADAAVVLDEPERLAEDHDGWWQRLQDAHERSGVGNLVRPEELYVTPEAWRERVAQSLRTGCGAAWIGVERWRGAGGVQLASHAALPRRGAEAAGGGEEALRGGRARGAGGRLHGRVGTAGGYFQRIPGALPAGHAGQDGQRQRGGHLLQRRERGDHADLWVCARQVWNCRRRSWCCSAPTICSTIPRRARPGQPKQRSKTSAFLSDFRDLAAGDYVVHVEHGIGQYQGLREIPQADGSKAEFMVLEYAEGRAAVCSADPAGSGAEVSLGRGRARGAEPAGHAAVGEDQGAGEEGHAGHGRRAAETLRPAQDRARISVLRRQPVHARV